jgi:hypothetical protein
VMTSQCRHLHRLPTRWSPDGKLRARVMAVVTVGRWLGARSCCGERLPV